jgi:orotate phosphoribosyltransferase
MAFTAQTQSQEEADRAALFQIILAASFGRKEVVLSSGRPSTFYFDMKPTMMDPHGAYLIARLMLPLLSEARADFIGGLEMGAVPITGAILSHGYERGQPVRGFFVRKTQKEHGARKLVEGLREGETLLGRRVVVFDDVTTSGASAMLAAQACRAAGAEVVQALAIVDRQEGADELFAREGIAFRALFTAAEFLAVA